MKDSPVAIHARWDERVVDVEDLAEHDGGAGDRRDDGQDPGVRHLRVAELGAAARRQGRQQHQPPPRLRALERRVADDGVAHEQPDLAMGG